MMASLPWASGARLASWDPLGGAIGREVVAMVFGGRRKTRVPGHFACAPKRSTSLTVHRISHSATPSAHRRQSPGSSPQSSPGAQKTVEYGGTILAPASLTRRITGVPGYVHIRILGIIVLRSRRS